MNSTKEIASLWLNDCVISPLGNGHIHDTYLLENEQSESRLVLQRINGKVFPNPTKLMSQTVMVLSHLNQTDSFEVPRLVESRNGQVMEFQEDCYWRAWTFIEGSRTIDPIEKVQQAESAAEAFGLFQCVMEKIDITKIEKPIPGYQRLSYYMSAFEEVRKKVPADLLDTVESSSWLVERFEDVNSVVHGDCKINNVLFDEGVDRVKAIIDLDTVMPGHWAWDFGDFVRSLWFGRKTIDLELFRYSIRGFLRGAPSRSYLPEDFAEAPFYISFMLGIRFLTDHLQGDSYFKVSARGDNLRRALEQFTLFENCVSARESLLQLAAQALEAHER